ncbi:MAG: tyrosine-type recombinase/integrase [Gemmataceae bacterium]
MSLTDATVRNAKPTAKPFKLSDGGGLFLLVQPSGGKWWRYKYRFAGKEKLLALGAYPDISLADARERHSQARKILAAGNDPSEVRKDAKRLMAIKAENNLEVIAREWHQQHIHEWATHYSRDVINRLETHIFPKLGPRPIADITATEILAVLRVIEKSGALDMAQRMMQTCGQLFRYAVTTGRAERNPVADLRGALKTPVRKHHAHLTADELPDFLEKLECYHGEVQTKLALQMLLLTFVRTTELRGAEWAEVNFDKAEWRIPAERMKMKDQHIVPLSRQAIEILRELQKHTGNRQYLFPNQHKPANYMSGNTMIYALYRMGYHSRATGHGFRATASTILNEHGFVPDVIERQLAHCERNKVRAAYNHAQYLPERRKMMQWWADYLEGIARKK